MLKITIENNFNNLPIPQNNQLRLANNNSLNHNQLFLALALSNCVWLFQKSRNSRPEPTPSLSILGIY